MGGEFLPGRTHGANWEQKMAERKANTLRYRRGELIPKLCATKEEFQ